MEMRRNKSFSTFTSKKITPRLSSYQSNIGKFPRDVHKYARFLLKHLRKFLSPLPHTSIPPFVLLLLGTICIGVASLVAAFSSDTKWASAELWRWFVWFGTAFIGLPVFAFPLSIMIISIGYTFYATPIYYYSTGTANQVSVLLWTITLWIITPHVLNGISDHAFDIIRQIFTSLVVICFTHIVLVLSVKAAIAFSRKKAFWSTVNSILKKERIVYKLAFKELPSEITDSETINERRTIMSRISSEVGLLDVHKLTKNSFFSAWEFLKESSKTNTCFRYEPGTEPKNETKAVARLIYDRLNKSKTEKIYVEDFMRIFPTKEKATEAYSVIDMNSTEEVSYLGLEVALNDIFAEKKSLHKMLHDRESIASVVRLFCTGAWFIVMIPIVLIIFNVDFEAWIVTFGAFFLGLSFIFGNTARRMFENILLIYVVRPYDVGDRVTFGTFPTLIISSVHLLTTEAFAPDGRHFIVPNELVLSNVVTQLKRSRDYAVSIDIIVEARTPPELIQELKLRVENWMKNDKAPWKVALSTDWIFYTKLVENNNKMTLGIWVYLEGVNWQRPGFYLKPTSNLLLAIQRFCRELDIEYVLPPQQIRLQPTPNGVHHHVPEEGSVGSIETQENDEVKYEK